MISLNYANYMAHNRSMAAVLPVEVALHTIVLGHTSPLEPEAVLMSLQAVLTLWLQH